MKLNYKKLERIIENHQHWLNKDIEGWEDMRADLTGMDLNNLWLKNVNLREASLSYVNLFGAHLDNVDLRDAYMFNTNLEFAVLRGADLSGAYASQCNLRKAIVTDARLIEIDLSMSNLQDAYLNRSNLRKADLWKANLLGADLCNADLREAKLDFSNLPLWCGSLETNFDSKQLKQIAYHLVKAGLQSQNATEEDKVELRKLIDYANQFHRAEECGIIEIEEDK